MDFGNNSGVMWRYFDFNAVLFADRALTINIPIVIELNICNYIIN